MPFFRWMVSQHYAVAMCFANTPLRIGMFQARATLLGRMGKHQGALEIYVYKLNDYAKAEEFVKVFCDQTVALTVSSRYCRNVYQSSPDPKGVFMVLLKIFLRPSTPTSTYLRPALQLIGRHSPRLDPVETMQLLPPLVAAADVRPFLCEALRAPPKLNTRVHREIWKARAEQVGWRLMMLQEKRVKITDSRM